MSLSSLAPTRRAFLASSAAFAASAALPLRGIRAAEPATVRLRAAPSSVRLAPSAYGPASGWAYDGRVPGPEIRVRQGDRLRVEVENALPEATTVHWHGLRVPNAMDGVPHLTQAPIPPGEVFVYEFDAVDAGTFWYHPHMRSFEQVGRGLYGPLIVEEAEPPRVDREAVWVLDDWRLTPDGEISDDFGNGHDAMHGGRVGNTVTINGRIPDRFPVRSGERLRLRLVNAANARVFALDFADHAPLVIAIDGQPVAPHAPQSGRVTLGPGMRIDLVLDMTGAPGSRATVTDTFYERMAYRLVDLAYADEALRDGAPDWPLDLPANPLPEPDVAAAERHEVTFNGGMMGAMVMAEMGGSMGEAGGMGSMMGGRAMGGGMMGGMMSMSRPSGMWFVNGVAADGHLGEPVLTLARGRSHVLSMTNATAWHHPIHLHGHSFRVVSRDGRPTPRREWQDTVLMAPRERVEVALVADNPGDWMFHCHILEHQAAGMMGVVRVG